MKSWASLNCPGLCRFGGLRWTRATKEIFSALGYSLGDPPLLRCLDSFSDVGCPRLICNFFIMDCCSLLKLLNFGPDCDTADAVQELNGMASMLRGPSVVDRSPSTGTRCDCSGSSFGSSSILGLPNTHVMI